MHVSGSQTFSVRPTKGQKFPTAHPPHLLPLATVKKYSAIKKNQSRKKIIGIVKKNHTHHYTGI